MPISIDIGTRNLHLIEGEARGKNVTVNRMVIETLPTGLVQDGQIRDFSGLSIAIKNMLQKNKIRDRNCTITINGTHIYTRELDVPKAAPKVLSNMIAFEVQNAMNVSKEISVEFVATKQQNPDKPSLVHVRASAIPTDSVLEYGKLLASAKLKPLAMDIHPNAIAKLVNGRTINGNSDHDSNIMIVDIGFVTTTAYVISNGDITYTRIIPIGTIDIERYCINSNSDEKRDPTVNLDEINLSLNNLRLNQPLGDAVRPLVTGLTDGINRIQQFMSGRIQGNKIEKIYIYGRGSVFAGFDETLSESMRLKVERVERLNGITTPAGASPAPFLNAIGALIRNKG